MAYNGKSVLVIGGGIAGIQASLDLANGGFKVYLVEKEPSIGGRMAQLDKTFPTMDCSICILAPKMVECARHPNVELITYAEVKGVKKTSKGFKVKVFKKPRYVDEKKCVGCGICVEKCPVKVPSEFDALLGQRKAIYFPFPQAIPRIVTIDKERCLYFTKGVCRVCEKFCDAKAVDFEQKPQAVELNVRGIIVAVGFNPADPAIIPEYGYGRFTNVISALQFERLANASGPTRGEIKRPSDGAHPKRIAFIQCVGSRAMERGQPYCSAVCCMHAVKEAILAKEHDPEVEVYIFHNEFRAVGKGFQEFVNRAQSEYGIKYVRSLPGEVFEMPKTKNLVLRYEETLTGKISELEADMVVLCTALVPRENAKELAALFGLELDEYGFFRSADPLYAPVDTNRPRIYICGCCEGPKDIPDSIAQASAASARAMEAAQKGFGG